MVMSSAQFAVEPGFRRIPFTVDGATRNLERLGGLFHAQPSEEPQLDDLALARVEPLEGAERVVERDQITSALGSGVQRLDQRYLRGAAAARDVNKDVAHYPRCDCEEMRAVLP